MKKISIILSLLLMTMLTACHNTQDKKHQESESDPVPQTITQQEVARIALLEAQQLLSNAQKSQLNTKAAEKTYLQAQALYKEGAFKKAQIMAVDVRHQLESLKQ